MQDQIILYNGPNSPFGRKTKVTALAQEVNLEEKIINVYEADFIDKHNPLRKIPTLVTNQSSITDSDNICLYLDSISKKETLFPKKKLLGNNEHNFYCQWIDGICIRKTNGNYKI